MKHFVILLSALILTQGLTEDEASTFRKAFERDTEELLAPLLKEYAELKNLIEEVKQFQQTQTISSLVFGERLSSLSSDCLPTATPFIETWDTDACLNLTTTLADAVELAENMTSWVFKASLTISQKLYNLLHCGSINPITAIKCFIDGINDVKGTIDSFKPIVNENINEIVALAKELKVEFDDCLYTSKIAQAVAKQVVVEAQLCVNMKSN
uniref:Putative secreted protein n=1 Tax=Panstrongylus lignarius TaxID=156445 RepID=A0A224XXH6_9HEMI